MFEYTRFEKARIVGARALQISMGAPTLMKIPKDVINPIDIAMIEFKNDAIPITVKRAEQKT
jgi:DNA-directed RNA polymerase subunit K